MTVTVADKKKFTFAFHSTEFISLSVPISFLFLFTKRFTKRFTIEREHSGGCLKERHTRDGLQ